MAWKLLDVRDLGGHLDTTLRGWSAALAVGVGLVITRLLMVAVLPRDFDGRLRVVRTMFIPGALHVFEASLHSLRGLLKLVAAVWSKRQPLTLVLYSVCLVVLRVGIWGGLVSVSYGALVSCLSFS